MPSTTSGGLAYPLPTDAVDVAGDIQRLAQSAEVGLAWVTTGGVAGTGWAITSQRYRRIGGFVYWFADLQRTAAAPAFGGADTISLTTPESMFTLPAGYRPTYIAGWWNANNQRLAAGYVQTDGGVWLNKVVGASLPINSQIRIASMYPLG